MRTARRRRPVLAAFALVALVLPGAALADGDPAAGKQVFRKCSACHTVQAGKNRLGPSLAGIVGRVPGTVDGFAYSAAMKAYGAAGHVWDDATLDAYLAAPKNAVKGTRMAFVGLPDAKERADVIAYLKAAGAE